MSNRDKDRNLTWFLSNLRKKSKHEHAIYFTCLTLAQISSSCRREAADSERRLTTARDEEGTRYGSRNVHLSLLFNSESDTLALANTIVEVLIITLPITALARTGSLETLKPISREPLRIRYFPVRLDEDGSVSYDAVPRPLAPVFRVPVYARVPLHTHTHTYTRDSHRYGRSRIRTPRIPNHSILLSTFSPDPSFRFHALVSSPPRFRCPSVYFRCPERDSSYASLCVKIVRLPFLVSRNTLVTRSLAIERRRK